MGASGSSHKIDARILIAGGGVAALEAALALQDLAGNRLSIDLYSPREEFVYRPYSVTSPFQHDYDLRFAMDSFTQRCAARFHRASIVSADVERRTALTQHHEEVRYDYLIIACGARMLQGVPGAVTFWGIVDDPRVDDLMRDFRHRALRRMVFTMPAGGSWTMPMYELALLAQHDLAETGADPSALIIATPEEAPLRLFGHEASRKVTELMADRGIAVRTGTTPVRFRSGRLQLVPGPDVEADAVISLPRLEGRKISGIPHDRDGFIPVNDHCEVRGMSRIYAVGDVTNFPVKQGGIAAQQADVAAESIVADILDREPTTRFDDPILRGVLFTGDEPLYLSGHLAGGHGESSAGSAYPLWAGGTQDDKIVAKHLTSFLRSEVHPRTARR